MHNIDEIKTYISGELNESEVILWAGSPSGMKLLDMPYRISIFIRWAICLAVACFAFWYRFIFFPTTENLSVNPTVVFLIMLAIAAAVALLPLKDMRFLKGKCYYYITNQRALLLFAGSSRFLKEKRYADTAEITFDLHAENRGNIYIGEKRKNSCRQARVNVLTRSVEEEDKKRLLIFYSVMNPEEVCGMFPPLDAAEEVCG